MKMFAAAFCALNFAMIFPSAVYPQRANERRDFRVQIVSAGKGGPGCTVTNLSGKPVGALVLEASSSSQPARKTRKVWDSLLESQPPIEPGAGISRPLVELGLNPRPDQVRVIAVVWTDGETFGAPASVNLILNIRARQAARI